MTTFLLILQAIIGAALVGVILMQQSEGGGLGMGGSPSGLMSARGAADFLTRATTVLASIFVVLSIVQAVRATRTAAPTIDTSLARPATPTPATPAPATGALPGAGAPVDPLAAAPAGGSNAPVVPLAGERPVQPQVTPAAPTPSPASTSRTGTREPTTTEPRRTEPRRTDRTSRAPATTAPQPAAPASVSPTATPVPSSASPSSAPSSSSSVPIAGGNSN